MGRAMLTAAPGGRRREVLAVDVRRGSLDSAETENHQASETG